MLASAEEAFENREGCFEHVAEDINIDVGETA